MVVCSLYIFFYRCFLRTLTQFLIGLCIFLLLKFKSSLYFWITAFYPICLLEGFLTICSLSFYFFNNIFHGTEFCILFYFILSYFYFYFILGTSVDCSYVAPLLGVLSHLSIFHQWPAVLVMYVFSHQYAAVWGR